MRKLLALFPVARDEDDDPCALATAESLKEAREKDAEFGSTNTSWYVFYVDDNGNLSGGLELVDGVGRQ